MTVNYTLFLIYFLQFFIETSVCCSPFSMETLGIGQPLPSMSVASTDQGGARARGQSTHLGLGGEQGGTLPLGSSSNPPIVSSDELSCSDFDNSCKWRNMEGLFVDELDWFQGSGLLDQSRLQVATGTHVYPDGMYAIVATDVVQLPMAKAALVSDQIACQRGVGLLRFMYWISPGVQLKVCTKSSTHAFPDITCHEPTFEGASPGPAIVQIPPQNGAFQIYIIADHFTFQAVSLQGGFAIIDDIQYDAEMCSTGGSDTVQQNQIETFPSHTSSSSSEAERTATALKDHAHFPTLSVHPIDAEVTQKPFMFIAPTMTRRTGPLPGTVMTSSSEDNSAISDGINGLVRQMRIGMMGGTSRERGGISRQLGISSREAVARAGASREMNQQQPVGVSSNEIGGPIKEDDVGGVLAACEALTCSFNQSQPCKDFAISSSWEVSSTPIGNPLTGIKGDASELPFNRVGSFGYVAGPRPFTRLSTAPFYIDRHSLFVFSYHKLFLFFFSFYVDRSSRFRVIAKKAESTEETLLFEAPQVNKDSRRWFREGRDLPLGQYDYLAFEIRDLTSNNYIGVDEWMLVDQGRRAYCGLS